MCSRPFCATKAEGRGLGLAVSYSIVVNHGGAITLASEVGREHTFTVYLPVASGSALTPPPNELELVRGAGRVLVMDDKTMVRDIAGRIIGELGYRSPSLATARKPSTCGGRPAPRGNPSMWWSWT